MPLAHPLSARTTTNFSEQAVAISFATALPGENVNDFNTRITDVGPWGQSGVSRHRVELVFTREAALKLIEILVPVVGRREVGRMIDTP